MSIILEVLSEESIHACVDGCIDETGWRAVTALAMEDAEVAERLEAYLQQNRLLTTLVDRLDPIDPIGEQAPDDYGDI